MKTRSNATLPTFALSLCIVGVVALLGAIATSKGVASWYPTLAKPPFTPPDWIFGPVWTTLYAAMGYAAWRVWHAGASRARTLALWLYAVQLGLNLAWSWIFFHAQLPAWALADLILLIAFVISMIVHFSRVDRLAAWIMAPYLLWLLFAALLNAAIVRLN